MFIKYNYFCVLCPLHFHDISSLYVHHIHPHLVPRWFIIDVLTLGPDWALEIVAWSSPAQSEWLGVDETSSHGWPWSTDGFYTPLERFLKWWVPPVIQVIIAPAKLLHLPLLVSNPGGQWRQTREQCISLTILDGTYWNMHHWNVLKADDFDWFWGSPILRNTQSVVSWNGESPGHHGFQYHNILQWSNDLDDLGCRHFRMLSYWKMVINPINRD